ncbi:MAG: L,D-transpeptidase family protein [Deltaproteobacteria bacterium]|nr:L,D-transpeptidase family protein [Deltaproteobacteria bacterium]
MSSKKCRIILLIAFLLYATTPLYGAQPPATRHNLCTPPYPSDSLLEWSCVRLKPGDTLEKLFGDSWQDVARFNRIDRVHSMPGTRIKVPKTLSDIKGFTPLPHTYAEKASLSKFILLDLTEQFLGAYEYGKLVFSAPVTTGEGTNKTPAGEFFITAHSRNHKSSKYKIHNTDIPYPMNYGLRFLVTKSGVSYWIHGRDVPGRPASHGCVGLYDEAMQKKYYGVPKDPVLEDAKSLYEWATGQTADGVFSLHTDGPQVLIIGEAP